MSKKMSFQEKKEHVSKKQEFRTEKEYNLSYQQASLENVNRDNLFNSFMKMATCRYVVPHSQSFMAAYRSEQKLASGNVRHEFFEPE